jgi:hypothetical protein
MATPQAFLARWSLLTQELTRLVDAALDVEPPGGSTPAWAALCARLGVTPLSEDDRFAEVRAAPQAQGAPLSEVRAAVGAFFLQARAPVTAALTPAQVNVVTHALETLRQAAERQVLEAVQPKARRGLFSHAKKLAREHRSAAWAGSQGYVLTCERCGGPRLEAGLDCVFCGGNLT